MKDLDNNRAGENVKPSVSDQEISQLLGMLRIWLDIRNAIGFGETPRSWLKFGNVKAFGESPRSWLDIVSYA